MEDANGFMGLPCITEFCLVTQDENGSVRRSKTFAGGLEMPGKNRRFIDPSVRKKSICCLGVSPILAS